MNPHHSDDERLMHDALEFLLSRSLGAERLIAALRERLAQPRKIGNTVHLSGEQMAELFPQPPVAWAIAERQGIALRDYFAAKAMQGLCAGNSTDAQQIARAAYIVADAMLKARGKTHDERLAQPEQETVREPDYWQEEARRYAGDRDYWRNRYEALVEPLTEALAQPEQEPVATLLLQAKQNYERNFGPSAAADWIYSDLLDLLDTAPPQRKPLTDEDTVALIKQCRDAFAEELGAWDIEPPIHHVQQGYDNCVNWLAAHGIKGEA